MDQDTQNNSTAPMGDAEAQDTPAEEVKKPEEMGAEDAAPAAEGEAQA